MRVVPDRSPWLQILAVFGGFMIGPYAGLQISMTLVPDSDLVQSASVLGFAMVFVGGTLFWMGFGMATVVVAALWNLARGRAPWPQSPGPARRTVPPGYRSYVVLGIAVGISVGLLAGLATNLPWSTATSVWTITGSGYGLLLWAAAHHGYLPFLEE